MQKQTEMSRGFPGDARAVVDSLLDALCVFSDDGTLMDVNPAACRLLGRSRETLLNTRVPRLLAPSSRDVLREIRTAIIREGGYTGNTVVLRPDGTRRHVSLTCTKLRDGGGPRILAIVRDVEDRIMDERRLRQAAVVFERSNEGILVADAGRRIVRANDAAVSISGFDHESLLAAPLLTLLVEGENRPEEILAEVLTNGHWAGEVLQRRPDGEAYPAWLSVAHVLDDQDSMRNFIAMFHDVTDYRRAEQRIVQLAHYDPLTGLPNRALFQDRLDRALLHAARTGTCVALLFIDLDNFKAINDSLGHLVGDELLNEVAERLRCCVREEDTIARMGGDEFTVLLGDLGDDVVAQRIAARIARWIHESLGMVVKRGGHEMFTDASIGIALHPRDAAKAEDLVRCADTAMYEAKKLGKGRYQFFSERMDAEVKRRLAIENGLRRALGENGLRLYYQPQVDAGDGRIIGLEALLRWVRPDGHVVAPAEFIDIAEESGLIVPMGWWVLHEACSFGRRLLDHGCDPGRIAVNICPRQLAADDFLDRVNGALAETGFPASNLELEVTERAFMGDMEQSSRILEAVRQAGVTVAIDDFGTGYSSLRYLKHLPVDRLKIDRSFIRSLESDGQDQAIVRTIVDLGRRVGMDVLAEGVETGPQAASLREMGCHQLQGYWFGRPVDEDQAARIPLRADEGRA